MGQGAQYTTGVEGKQNTRKMPGSCQPRARIGVSCCAILLGTQTAWAEAIGRRALSQRSTRHVLRQDALPIALGQWLPATPCRSIYRTL